MLQMNNVPNKLLLDVLRVMLNLLSQLPRRYLLSVLLSICLSVLVMIWIPEGL